MSIASIWAGFGGPCQDNNGADPIVLYDKLADRWLISQFTNDSQNPPQNHQCIAISTSRDATGSYYRYDFEIGAMFGSSCTYDYPKLATWPDAYYMADNVSGSGNCPGPEPFAFDRTKMLCGLRATVISPGRIGSPASTENLIMPSDFDGTVLPPPGAPNSFVEFPDINGNNAGTYRTWHYHVDFAVPTNSTFTQFAGPIARLYTCLCGCAPQGPCVPENASNSVCSNNSCFLNGIGDRLMFRLAYRNFGTPSAPNESSVCNFSVSADGAGGLAAPRWFELKNVTNGPVLVNQEGTYQPGDTTWRWMGSVAMDHSGDLAVGYSASSSSIYPQIRYAGRLSTDPPNTLAQGEAHLFDGAGSESSHLGRWGDYSGMAVDPVDDTTMWYTNEYYATSDFELHWSTRIGNFRINANQPLLNVSAKSELNHGPNIVYNPFDIDLPLYAGAMGPGRGVECRSPSGGIYTIIFNFTNSVTAVGGVTSTCGTATAVIGTDNHQVLVRLSAGSCNAQYITVQLNNVSDGVNTINAPVTFGLLIGDTNGDGTVDTSDYNQTKLQLGMSACPPNFREDVDANGTINASDLNLVSSNMGHSLPTPP